MTTIGAKQNLSNLYTLSMDYISEKKKKKKKEKKKETHTVQFAKLKTITN